MSQTALPADYVRPSLAEYLAASPAHTTAGYLPFVQSHEDELRKHTAAAEPVTGLDSIVPAVTVPLHYDAPESLLDRVEHAAVAAVEGACEYVRDAGGIITGTRPIAALETLIDVAEEAVDLEHEFVEAFRKLRAAVTAELGDHPDLRGLEAELAKRVRSLLEPQNLQRAVRELVAEIRELEPVPPAKPPEPPATSSRPVAESPVVSAVPPPADTNATPSESAS